MFDAIIKFTKLMSDKTIKIFKVDNVKEFSCYRLIEKT